MSFLVNDMFYLTEDQCIEKWSNLRTGSHINNRTGFCTPLTKAVNNKWLRMVDLLIGKGADIEVADSFNETALFIAIRTQNTPMVHLLLKHNADMRANDYRAVKAAIAYTNIAAIKLFMEIDPTITDEMIILKTHCSRYHTNKITRYIHAHRLFTITLVLHTLPQYIILWITDWFLGSEQITEFEKVRYIEAIQRSISQVRKVDLLFQ